MFDKDFDHLIEQGEKAKAAYQRISEEEKQENFAEFKRLVLENGYTQPEDVL